MSPARTAHPGPAVLPQQRSAELPSVGQVSEAAPLSLASPLPARARSAWQSAKDCLTIPLRALTLFENDRWGLSSLASDRFYYVAREVRGYCLDVGCGRRNRFVTEFLHGHGKGIDVYPYNGLSAEQVLEDLTQFPFPTGMFDSVTLIANLNHIPASQRDQELAEAFRCLKPGGNLIITMGHPVVEIIGHKLVHWYDRLLGTRHDVDGERGMHHEESYYVREAEIRRRLTRAGFTRIAKKRFVTQWGLNALYVGWRPAHAPS